MTPSSVDSVPMLPNLLIAGVTKAGTTSLFHYLGQHQAICPSDVKAIDHYSPIVYGRAPLESMEQYAAHFSACADEPWRLEASPAYFRGGAALIDALQADLPEVRVVISLRDPVSRLWSGYTYKRSKGRLPDGMDFDAFIDTCLTLRSDGRDMLPENFVFRTLSTGIYVDYLRPWVEAFGERLRVVFFEDLVADPPVTVGGICGWLGLGASVDGFDFTTRNKTQQPRSVALRRAAGRVNARLAPVLRDRPMLKRAATATYGRLNAGGTQPEVFTPEARTRARQFYQPSVDRLVTLLREHGLQSVPDWVG